MALGEPGSGQRHHELRRLPEAGGKPLADGSQRRRPAHEPVVAGSSSSDWLTRPERLALARTEQLTRTPMSQVSYADV